ncbi:family 20 glycosylhydrolase [Maribellus comscasis]|uniref:beta-N-acetylhexosaminidase n=1 Tax=Maribellus comscasis TaxID=2681766 RepID=A0A6I6JR34_9BACT|nr:beta-N-acetylhexosaminidase [Maribellus comscasis]QGY43510.1 family 20 glycosylhydrolase [Maribellus comscasis]
MKNKFGFAGILALVIFQIGCTQQPSTDLSETAFIPKPVSIDVTGNSFELKESSVIYYEESVEGLQTVAEYLALEIKRTSGVNLKVESTNATPKKGVYFTVVNEDSKLDTEGYELNIGKKLIAIKAKTVAGCFYGVQTLLQIIPEKLHAEDPIEFATGIIRDFPEFGYRGAMLDVSRHFFNVEEVKQFIDFLAMYKMNILHLHLSDDQGWRIEIKSWPKLTEIGGSTEVGGGTGGFYTQEQYTELVKYAQERQITIIPEIDMPGHTNAALASYAELNCDGKARELYTGTEVGFSTFCTDKEITYQFIDDVIRELAALTPGPYIHIGGDESHVTAHDDYVYFVNRVQPIVLKYGKKVIGWDEIANAELVDDATVQFWADVENTTTGVEKGARVIMSPAARAYLDMQYDSTTHLGLHWAGYIEVDHGYTWNPATLVPGVTKENIIGVEAPLWSETVTNMDEVEFLVFPRLPGYAEIGWTAPEKRDWNEYKMRLAKHGKRFEDLGINFYKSKRVPWEE